MRRARWRNARDATSVEAAVTTAADTEADGEATEAAVVVAAGDSARRERLTPPRGARRGRVSAGGRYEECHVGTSTCRPTNKLVSILTSGHTMRLCTSS